MSQNVLLTSGLFFGHFSAIIPNSELADYQVFGKILEFFVIILEFSCQNPFLQKSSRFFIKTFRFHMFWVCYWICWVFHVRWSQLRIVYLSVRDQSWRILKFSAFSHLSFLKNCAWVFSIPWVYSPWVFSRNGQKTSLDSVWESPGHLKWNTGLRST